MRDDIFIHTLVVGLLLIAAISCAFSLASIANSLSILASPPGA